MRLQAVRGGQQGGLGRVDDRAHHSGEKRDEVDDPDVAGVVDEEKREDGDAEDAVGKDHHRESPLAQPADKSGEQLPRYSRFCSNEETLCLV